jgi:hypothetical protein
MAGKFNFRDDIFTVSAQCRAVAGIGAESSTARQAAFMAA